MQTTNIHSYIDDRLAILPKDYADFLGSAYLRDITERIGSGYEFTNDQITLLQNTTALLLLFLITKAEFLLAIQENLTISDIDARNIYEILLNQLPDGALSFLEDFEHFSSSENSDLQTGIKKTELAALAQTFAEPQPERLENPDVDMFTSNVEPLRTMEGDINRIHGYGVVSEQEESAEDQAVEDEQPITPKTDTATLSSE